MNRRKLLGFVGASTAGMVAGCVGGDEGDGTDDVDNSTSDIEDAGVVTVTADEDSVDAAFDRITTAIEENENLGIVAQLDHSANAASVGLDLDPTRVVFFGNPEAGTPLMQNSQRVGLDLPQRMVVWEENGDVTIAYNDPEYIAARHGIEGQDELLENIAGALDALATSEM